MTATAWPPSATTTFSCCGPCREGFSTCSKSTRLARRPGCFRRNDASPYSSGSNPVKLEETVQIPSADSPKVLFLDRNTGVEHLYAVFSSTQWPELERALTSPGPTTPKTQSSRPDLLATAIRSPNGMRTRGVGGVRDEHSIKNEAETFLIQRLDNDKHASVSVSSASIRSSGSFMVIERWFKHE